MIQKKSNPPTSKAIRCNGCSSSVWKYLIICWNIQLICSWKLRKRQLANVIVCYRANSLLRTLTVRRFKPLLKIQTGIKCAWRLIFFDAWFWRRWIIMSSKTQSKIPVGRLCKYCPRHLTIKAKHGKKAGLMFLLSERRSSSGHHHCKYDFVIYPF